MHISQLSQVIPTLAVHFYHEAEKSNRTYCVMLDVTELDCRNSQKMCDVFYEDEDGQRQTEQYPMNHVVKMLANRTWRVVEASYKAY